MKTKCSLNLPSGSNTSKLTILSSIKYRKTSTAPGCKRTLMDNSILSESVLQKTLNSNGNTLLMNEQTFMANETDVVID